MVRYRVQKALYQTGKLFTQKTTYTLSTLGFNESIKAYLKDITDNVLREYLDTPIDELRNFDYNEIQDLYIPKTSSIIKQCQILRTYVYKNFDVLLKSKRIVADLEKYKEQLSALQRLKEKYEQQMATEGAQDAILPVTMEQKVVVDLSTQYLLYQHLFGYPQDGVWDTEKLQIIAEALANAQLENNDNETK